MLKTTTSVINASQIATPIIFQSDVTLLSTDAGAAAAPLLDLYRNSASPAASDTIGEIEFNGQDSAGNKQQYALIHGSILSPTSTAETGQIHFETATGGASTEKMIIGTTNLVINDIGAIYNVRIEGDTDANLFFTDATNSRVGIGIITPAEKLDVVGNIKLSGNVIPASGFGIDFAATAGTGTSELLADYEEGIWTPTLVPTVTGYTSITYDAVTKGKYTKIGSLVQIQGLIRTSAITVGSASGGLTIGDLPFQASAASSGTDNGSASISIGYVLSWAVNAPVLGVIFSRASSINLYTKATVAGGAVNLNAATDVGTGASANVIYFTATYRSAT
jgi:hypothetical protein